MSYILQSKQHVKQINLCKGVKSKLDYTPRVVKIGY